jgi:branched-chain amino acid transport system permease protein
VGYLLFLLTLLLIYAALAASLNLVFGWTGLLAVSHASFMGVGAYATALLMLRGWDVLPALAVAAALAGAVAWALARATLRLREEYYVIASFGFQVIAYNVFNNLVKVTGGPMGLTGVPVPALFGRPLGGQAALLVLTALVVGVLLLAVFRMGASPYGRVLRTIREDETLARALGKDVARYKTSVFTAAGAVAGVAGGLFGTLLAFVHPSSFSIHEAIFLLSMVIVGGGGSFAGGVLGAAVLTLLPEALSFVTVLEDIAPQLRQITYAVLVILFLVRRPQGLWPEAEAGSRG